MATYDTINWKSNLNFEVGITQGERSKQGFGMKRQHVAGCVGSFFLSNATDDRMLLLMTFVANRTCVFTVVFIIVDYLQQLVLHLHHFEDFIELVHEVVRQCNGEALELAAVK